MTTGGETPVNDLLAKQEIYECILRYCRGTDRNDRDLIAGQYHPDGVDDHGLVGEQLGTQWADDLMGRDRTRTYVHHIGQVLIELYGDDAFAETCWVAYQSWEENGTRRLRTRMGRYADWFQYRGGAWKVLVRRVIDDWSKVETVESVIADRSVYTGAPYPRDPIYRLREQVIEHHDASA